MKMIFSGKKDVYLEVADKYKNYIKLGVLKNGDKLPSVRAAASELGINPNTMAKSYSLLEAEGYIMSIPKKGVYVTYDNGVKKIPPMPDKEAFKGDIRAYMLNKVIKEEIIQMVEEVYGK